MLFYILITVRSWDITILSIIILTQPCEGVPHLTNKDSVQNDWDTGRPGSWTQLSKARWLLLC